MKMKMKMKRFLPLLTALCIVLSASSCAGKDEGPSAEKASSEENSTSPASVSEIQSFELPQSDISIEESLSSQDKTDPIAQNISCAD